MISKIIDVRFLFIPTFLDEVKTLLHYKPKNAFEFRMLFQIVLSTLKCLCHQLLKSWLKNIYGVSCNHFCRKTVQC